MRLEIPPAATIFETLMSTWLELITRADSQAWPFSEDFASAFGEGQVQQCSSRQQDSHRG